MGRYSCMLLVMLGACTAQQSDTRNLSERPIRVVATTSIVADLVQHIGGVRVEVESLMGPGVDPHLYKASARDVTAMAAADIIVYNGLQLEGKMADLFEQMSRQNKQSFAIAEEGVPRSQLMDSEVYAGNYDPHIWFDPGLWAMAAEALAQRLAVLDSAHADHFAERLQAYRRQLRTADEYIRQRTASVAELQRVIITSHDAFRYFGQAYGFEVRGLQGISTAAEAGAADVRALAALVAERQIAAMFVETSVSPRGIEAVREAVRDRGFEVVIGGTLFGDALGGPGSGAETYIAMIRQNVDTIVDALDDAKRD